MVTMAPRAEDEGVEPEFTPLTAEQAAVLRQQEPSTSPWQIVAIQVAVGCVVALSAWGFTGRSEAGWSAAYGALVVVIPAALFARGLMSQFSSINAVTAGFGFFIWESLKISVSVGMLFAAPKLVPGLDWLVMLTSLIVTLKVYWVALLLRPKRKTV